MYKKEKIIAEKVNPAEIIRHGTTLFFFLSAILKTILLVYLLTFFFFFSFLSIIPLFSLLLANECMLCEWARDARGKIVPDINANSNLQLVG